MIKTFKIVTQLENVDSANYFQIFMAGGQHNH